MGSGPSLSRDAVDHVKKRQTEQPDQIATIAINNTYERAPWATDLYACDVGWWRTYRPTFKGRKWSQFQKRGTRFDPCQTDRIDGVQYIRAKSQSALNMTDARWIGTGGNSAFQAVNLAILGGAIRVVLLGVDLQPTDGKSHWHGDHPWNGQLTNPSGPTYAIWLKAFDMAASQLAHSNIEFIQASDQTALRSWPRMDIQTALKEPLNVYRNKL